MQEPQETHVQSLGWEDLEKEMAIHFSILAWKIPWTEEPGGLQSMRSQRVRCDWAHPRIPALYLCICNWLKAELGGKTSFRPETNNLFMSLAAFPLEEEWEGRDLQLVGMTHRVGRKSASSGQVLSAWTPGVLQEVLAAASPTRKLPQRPLQHSLHKDVAGTLLLTVAVCNTQSETKQLMWGGNRAGSQCQIKWPNPFSPL